MNLAEEIAAFGSVAVAGLAKNVGKTVTLNHLLREGHRLGLKLGATSIGIDGESIDLVSRSRKPEIKLYAGMHFATSEAHFRSRRLEAEVTGIAPRLTPLGRVVTARALSDGRILLSGPSDTASLRGVIDALQARGAETVLVDGALSRVSLASPAVTDALVLATGAALSPDIARIAARTAFVCSLAAIPEVEPAMAARLEPLTVGLWGIDTEGIPHSLGIRSALDMERVRQRIFRHGTTIFNPGLVSERLLRFLASQKEAQGMHLIVRDFTCLFVEPQTLRAFQDKGGRLSVLKNSRLLAVTVNPYSPAGFTVDKDRLIDALREKLAVPVVYIDPEL